MSNVQRANPQLPADVAALFGDYSFGEFSAGVSSGINVLSFRGKVWRTVEDGEEEMILNEADDPVSSLQLVLIAGSRAVSKTYYSKTYSDGDDNAPDCMSLLGDKPDQGSTAPQSESCATCRWNQWGSRMTDTGSRAKACQDRRRLAVAFATDIAKAIQNGTGADTVPLFLLSVPPASLKALLAYEQQMAKFRIPLPAMVTTVKFDPAEASPSLQFLPAAPVKDTRVAMLIAELRQNEVTAGSIIARSVELAMGGAAPVSAPVQNAQPAQPVQKAPEPAPEPTPAAAPATGRGRGGGRKPGNGAAAAPVTPKPAPTPAPQAAAPADDMSDLDPPETTADAVSNGTVDDPFAALMDDIGATLGTPVGRR